MKPWTRVKIGNCIIKIDREDMPRLKQHRWRTYPHPYKEGKWIYINYNHGVRIYLQRFITKVTEPDIKVWYISDDYSDLRKSNLRVKKHHIPTEMKVCKYCKTKKTIDNFTVYKSGASRSICHACRREQQRKRRATDPEFCNHLRANELKYRKKHRQERRETAKKWIRDNPERAHIIDRKKNSKKRIRNRYHLKEGVSLKDSIRSSIEDMIANTDWNS